MMLTTEKERIGIGCCMNFCYETYVNLTPRWKRYINETFPVRTRAATPRMMSGFWKKGELDHPRINCISYRLLRCYLPTRYRAVNSRRTDMDLTRARCYILQL